MNTATLNEKNLFLAAASGRLDVVKELLKIEAVRDQAAGYSNRILRLANEKDNLEIVSELLKIDAVRELHERELHERELEEKKSGIKSEW